MIIIHFGDRDREEGAGLPRGPLLLHDWVIHAAKVDTDLPFDGPAKTRQLVLPTT